MAEPIEANDDTWQQIVLDSETPVMVDFWAEWCGPCKMIAPAVHDMAVDYDGQLTVVKLDVDASPNTAMQYGIRSIPALLFFKDGQPVDQIVGAVPKGALKKKVDENPDSVAFSIFPSDITDVIKVADNNLTMPPKSTWFDPKPLDGLVVYEFN